MKNQITVNQSKINIHLLFSKSGLDSLESYLGIMGFKDMSDFDSLLNRLVTFKDNKINEKTKEIILRSIEEAVLLCSSVIEKEELNVFLFETDDKFIIDKMNGSSGFCTNKNCILILLNLENLNKIELINTFVHELAHALNNYYDMGNMSVGDGIVFDGIAENFREFVVDKKKSKIVSNVDERDVKKFIEKIKPILDSKKFNDYRDVFFGSGNYPLWLGYSIGYYLIKNYISKKKKINWKEIISQNPDIILKELL